MKARADKIAAAAGATKGEASAKTFENQKLAENLHINGTVDVKAAAEAVAQEASILETVSKAAIAFAGKAEGLVNSGDVGMLNQLSQTISGVTSHGYSKVADPASVGMAAPGEGLELFKSEPLPGNKAVIATVPASGSNAAAVAKAGYKLGTFDASKKVADKAQLTVLSTSDVQAIAKKIGDAASHLISYKSVQKEAEAAANKVIAAAEKKAKETAKGEDGKPVEGALSGSDARSIAKGAMSMVVNAAPPLAGFALNAGSYVLQYAEQSLKQYGKAPAAAKPEEKKPEPAAA
jgi:hypothetical protein